MRPYLALIKDSFREALASRVMWVLTGLIVLLLIALAPLGYQQRLTSRFEWSDLVEPPQLVAKLQAAAAASQPSPGKRIWSLLDETTRTRAGQLPAIVDANGLDDESEPPGQKGPDPMGGKGDRGKKQRPMDDGRGFFRGLEALQTGLNKLLALPDLYRAEDWKDVELPKEAREFIARPAASLSKEEQARLNRLLIESAAPANFRPRAVHSICISYLWFASDPLPFSKEQVDSFIKEWVLWTVMTWLVGGVGMVAAILVTSNIIPQIFDPGSINLLLSKPISRSLLFVSKFLGGCAFILLNVSLLISGLWLIAGWRFGIWNHGMLWCIPVFLFMFLVYYSVSSLVGLIWKSAIISVVVTVIFWAVCFALDVAAWGLGDFTLEPHRITRLIEADGALVTTTEEGGFQVWDEAARQWRTIAEARRQGIPTIDGPFFYAPTRQVLVGQGFRIPFMLGGQRVSLRMASASEGWTLRDGPAVPSGTSAILVTSDSSVLAVGHEQIFRLLGSPSRQGSTLYLFGMKVPLMGAGEFRPALATSETVNFRDPLAAAADLQQPRVVVCAANEVYLLTASASREYSVAAKQTLAGKATEASVVASGGESVLVGREDGKLWLLSAADLTVKKELMLEQQTQPRLIAAAPDGKRFAVLFQNRRLWLVDSATGDARLAPISSQGQISGVAWSADRLLVGAEAYRAVAYDSTTFARRQVYRPALNYSEMAYYYAVQPLNAIFPKPRMLDKTVQYFLTGKRTTDAGFLQGDLSQQREDLDPWRPVRSGLAFVAVVLLIACIYLERHEF